jgi:hypothetical protein
MKNLFVPVALALVQIAAGMALYRARVVDRWHGGDFVVLYLPPIAGFATQLFVLALYRQAPRRRNVFFLAAISAASAGCVSLLIGLNLYGG